VALFVNAYSIDRTSRKPGIGIQVYGIQVYDE